MTIILYVPVLIGDCKSGRLKLQYSSVKVRILFFLEEIGVSCMIKDRLTYIMEAAARLSPENQDRIIMAIEQLLGYEKKKIQLEFDHKKALSETGTDV